MTLVPLIKKEYIYKLAAQGKRFDGRKFEEYRPIKIETDVVKRAEGSARVSIGNTQVLAGIKMDLGVPYPDTPDTGVITTAAELIPLASPDFESGPPREDAIELARVVDRGIRESEIIDLNKLCILPENMVWIVFIDIHVLDYDGNLFDTASLAALAALSTTKVPIERFQPKLERTLEKMKDDKEQASAIQKYLKDHTKNYDLPIKEPPISCTSTKLGNVVVIDPGLDEEEVADARLTVATDNKGDIRAMQKGLSGSFTKEEIQKVIKVSLDTGRNIRKQLYKSIGK